MLHLIQCAVAVIVVADSGSLGVCGVVGRADNGSARNGLICDNGCSDDTGLGVLREALLDGSGIPMPISTLA